LPDCGYPVIIAGFPSSLTPVDRAVMATMVEPTVVTPEAEQSHGFLEALKKHQTLLTRGGIALAVVAVGIWFYLESGQRKEFAAADALDRARSALESGNVPVASAEFQKVAASYSGTEAGYQAALALNEARLMQGQTQIAVDDLRAFIGRNPPATHAASGQALLGTALENQGKFDEAAQAYARAAELAPESYRKVDAQLSRARSLRLAGKAEEALTTLRTIVSGYPEDMPGVSEAMVRLAELTKGAM
jgi:tetratricopeptide (TPR) repeat protein